MSYARWSTDCYQSDVYVYEDTQGVFHINVASRRRAPIKPTPKKLDYSNIADKELTDKVLQYWRECDNWLEDSEAWKWEDIPEKHKGQSYTAISPIECLNILLSLKEDGLLIPESAIISLSEV